MKKLLPLAIASVLASPQLHAAAAEYNGKSMALSGAGVASANYTYGVLLNPANAVHYEESDDFNLNLNLGAVLSDQDDMVDNGEDLADQLDALGTLDPALITTAELTQIRNTLVSLDDATARLSAGGNLSIAIPNKHASAVFFVNYVAAVEATSLITQDDLDDLQDLIDGTSTTPIDVNDLTSSVRATGVLMREIGISLAREFDIGGQPVAFGITPKHQNVEAIVYSETIANFDSDNFDADQFTEEDSNFNLDLGVSTHWQHWYLGASLTNVIEEDYDTVDPTVKAKVETKATVGGSYKNGWGMLSLDVDLNPTQYFGTPNDVQFVRVGAELDLWDTVQFRVGYRHDLEDNLDKTASAGIGFSPFGVVNLDLAVMAGENETYGAAVQLGASF